MCGKGPMDDSVATRARIAYAVAARESADHARELIGDLPSFLRPGERLRAARALRVLSLTVLDRAVLIERAEGQSWAAIGEVLGLSEAEARARYEETYAAWMRDAPGAAPGPTAVGDFALGLRSDQDLAGTAESVDQWYARHAEPLERVDSPVARAVGLTEPGQ